MRQEKNITTNTTSVTDAPISAQPQPDRRLPDERIVLVTCRDLDDEYAGHSIRGRLCLAGIRQGAAARFIRIQFVAPIESFALSRYSGVRVRDAVQCPTLSIAG